MKARGSNILILIAMALYSLPLWIIDRIPGREYTQHLLMVELSRRLGQYQEFYVPSWKLVPGTLFYWFARLLGPRVPVVITGKIALTIYVSCMILSFAYLSQVIHGRKGTPVFYGLLTIYGWFFYEGDLSLLLGIPIFLLAISLVASFLHSNKSLRNIRSMALLLFLGFLLYLSNLSLFILFLIGAFLGDALHREKNGSFAGLLVLATLLSGFLGYFILLAKQAQYFEGLDFDFLRSDGLGFPLLVHWPGFNTNLVFIFQSLAIWKNAWGFVLLSAPLAYYSVFFFRKGLSCLEVKGKAFIFSSYKILFIVLLAFFSLVLFLIFPSLLPYPGYKMLNWVYLVTAACLIIVLKCPKHPSWHERLICGVLIPMLNLIIVTSVHHNVEAGTKPLLHVIEAIPPAQKVLFLNFKRNDSPLFQNPYRFLPCEYHIGKGGYSPYTFAWYLASPVAYKKSFLRYPPLTRPGEFKKLVHRFGYDYIVLLGSKAEIPATVLADASSPPWKPQFFPMGVVVEAP